MRQLENKIIFISGAAGLIGKGFVEAVIKEGGVAIIADIDIDKANQLHHDLINKYGESNSYAVYLDINNLSSITSAINMVSKKYGKIDAIVNNAYPRNKQYGCDFLDVDLKDFNENVSLHLGGYFLMCQQFIKFFQTQGFGNIINMASIYGCIAPKFEVYDDSSMTMPVEYAAIKSAIIHLTKYIAKYVKDHKIRLNCLSPGGILDGQPKSFLSKYNAQCVNKGMLGVEDLLPTLIFLLSDGSTTITGQNIVVDDGFCL